MNFVQNLEECLRDLAAEARAQHPGVKEASERATLKLRSLKTSYVSAVRQASKTDQQHPTTALFQSSDLLHPFLLAANYPNASNNLLEIAFRAMKLLMEADAVVPTDGLHLVRVWMIQAQVVTAHYQKQFKELSQKESPTKSSWFGWGSSSNTSGEKTVVSSSTGQAGSGAQSGVAMERLALDILSCLLQLLDRLKGHPQGFTSELWHNAVALSCLWLSSVVPRRHKVQQAAQTTTVQVITLLFGNCDPKLAAMTWDDLLNLTTHRDTKCAGAFALCKRAPSHPPGPEFAIEIMTSVWKEGLYDPTDAVFVKTLSKTVALLQQKATTLERSLRVTVWSQHLFQAKATAYPNECRELVGHMVRPITVATDACRKHHDFEDGFIYDGTREDLSQSTKQDSPLVSFFPRSTLWRAGFALEAMNALLDSETPERQVLLANGRFLASLTESLSHFATIGASCRDHILQVVDFCDAQDGSNSKPSVMRKAEQGIRDGCLETCDDTRDRPSSILGECIWIALLGTLLIAQAVQEVDDREATLEEAFAPFLAVLQHYLKRFSGCRDLVDLSLQGYSILANACMPFESCAMQRKVLLTSLSKLSLPSWGKHDATVHLEDHHVRSLASLLTIVHVHSNSIGTDWDLILWTLEYLSVLSVSSPLLSDEAYHSALAISAIYQRLALFTTCLSSEALISFSEALSDIVEQVMRNRDSVSDSDALRAVPVGPEGPARVKDEKEGIGGKLVNMGVKAIYRNGDSEKANVVPVTERSRAAFQDEYRKSFVERMKSSSHGVRINTIGRPPFSLMLVCDIAFANAFRGQDFSESIGSHLSRVAASAPLAGPFAMDILALLITERLECAESGKTKLTSSPGKIVFEKPMLSQLLAVEPVRSETSAQLDVSHADAIAPICTTLKSTVRPDIAESSLEVLNMIIQRLGHQLQSNVWNEILLSLSSLSGSVGEARSGNDWSTCSLAAFRCFKMLIDDFLDELPSDVKSHHNRSAVLDCCGAFVSADHDINTSLTSIGLLWTVTDRIATNDCTEIALSKLYNLTLDTRAEVRNAAVNTLFSCIMGKGNDFSGDKWRLCLQSTVLALYEQVSTHLRAESTPPPTNKSRRASRYSVSRHHSRDSSNKQWVATQVLTVRGITRVLRAHFSSLLMTANEASNNDIPWFQDAWVKVLDCAWESASQRGDREYLDIRSCGVELLGVCAQLTSQAGIQAAIVPARVGTNMEVVNGALRSVRDNVVRVQREVSIPAHLDEFRTKLFLESFESLECYEELVHDHSKDDDFPSDTDLQILQKFATNMSSVYDCCQQHEFRSGTDWIKFQEKHVSDIASDTASLENRFVQSIVSVFRSSTKADVCRYLNQPQRCCFELLKKMGLNGSLLAISSLIHLSNGAFCIHRDTDSEEGTKGSSVTFLNHEAASNLVQIIIDDKLNLTIRQRALSEIIEDASRSLSDAGLSKWHHRDYSKLLPCLEAVFQTGSTLPDFDAFCVILSAMVSPIDLGEKTVKSIPAVNTVATIIELAKPVAISSNQQLVFSNSIAGSLDMLLDTAVLNFAFASETSNAEDRRKASRKHAEDVLHLFDVCLRLCFELNPESEALPSPCKLLMHSLLDCDQYSAMYAPLKSSTMTLCDALCQTAGTSPLVIACFPPLCRLVTIDDSNTREKACAVFNSVDIAATLYETRARYVAAEERAALAEAQVAALTNELREARRRS